MNKVIMMGRLTKDVELRETASGVKVAQFSIAVNRNFKNADGGYDADFFNCTAWRGTGEFIAKYFGKGDMIALSGKLQNRSWEDGDGNKRYATDIIVEEAHFCGSKQEKSNQGVNDTPNTNEPSIDDFVPVSVDDDLPWE